MYYQSVEVSHVGGNDLPWVPWEILDGAAIKLLKVDAVHGTMQLLLRVPAGARLGRHRHTGYVQVYTVQGSWCYLEHDWIAHSGDFVYETADSIHSFETLGEEPTIVFASLNGTLEFLDDDNQVVHIESWRTMLERQNKYLRRQGKECIDVSSFIPRADDMMPLQGLDHDVEHLCYERS